MCEVRKGYVIAAFNFTDMLEVERDDSMDVFEDDEVRRAYEIFGTK